MPAPESAREHWIRKMLVGGAITSVFSGAVISAIGWLALPRIDERVVLAMTSPAGQIAACGLPDCRTVATRIGVLERLSIDAQVAADRVTPAGPCLSRGAGLSVADGAAGEWIPVRLHRVCSLRDDCGVPVMSFTLINGGGMSHDVESSFSGRPLERGECADLNFLLRFGPDGPDPHPGFGAVLLSVRHPDMADPPLPQTIGPAPVRILESADANAPSD